MWLLLIGYLQPIIPGDDAFEFHRLYLKGNHYTFNYAPIIYYISFMWLNQLKQSLIDVHIASLTFSAFLEHRYFF